MSKAAQHRNTILHTAVRLFREKGYAATGLAEILSASGAPKGSLYYYFPSGKEQLAVEALLLAGDTVTQTLRELARHSASSREFFDGYCTLLAGWMRESGFRSGCPITTTVLETVPASKALSEAAAKVFADWRELVAGVYRAEGCSPERAMQHAELAISAIQGALIQARVQQSERLLLGLPEWLAT